MKPDKPLTDPAERSLEELIAEWFDPNRQKWAGQTEIHQDFAGRLFKAGECILAHDVASEGLALLRESDPAWAKRGLRLRQLQAMALARSGASEKACQLFQKLYAEGQRDEETLGGLARSLKDLALAATGERRTPYLRRSHSVYLESYQGHVDRYWTGINAATTALLLGENDTAQALARQVRTHCLEKYASGKLPGDEAYWLPATIGEAALLLREVDDAGRWYQRAVAAAPKDWGSISSTRRAARLIAQALGDKDAAAHVDRWLHIPNVVVFAGHMIDQRDRPNPRFPAVLEGTVRRAIRAQLEELDAGFGFASGACGSDILFLEALRDRDGEINIVLPYEEKGFIQESVNIVSGAKWGRRLKALTARRAPLIASTQHVRLGSVTYDYANSLLHGLAKMRADQLQTQLIPMAVWNGLDGDGRGGTADVVRRWQALKCDPVIVGLNTVAVSRRPKISSAAALPLRSTRLSRNLPREIKAMLFADVKGFSLIPEERLPRFGRQFLGCVARLIEKSLAKPFIRNTWGDALYLVFDSINVFDTVTQAGCFALDLRDQMDRFPWPVIVRRDKTPVEFGIRIAVHAGPVFSFKDPVIQRDACIGTHITRTARMEPITPPGQVYASLEFAALAALREQPFVCDYAGRVPLAKDLGTFPTYHVRRR